MECNEESPSLHTRLLSPYRRICSIPLSSAPRPCLVAAYVSASLAYQCDPSPVATGYFTPLAAGYHTTVYSTRYGASHDPLWRDTTRCDPLRSVTIRYGTAINSRMYPFTFSGSSIMDQWTPPGETGP